MIVLPPRPVSEPWLNTQEDTIVMPDKSQSQSKSGPQGTQLFSPEEVEAALAEQLKIKLLGGEEGSLLVGVSGRYDGQVFKLTDTKVSIGRAPDQHVVLDDPSVSKVHAQIVLDNGYWKVVNLLSSNGTFVNGKKVSIAPISDGDRLRFGQVELIFKAGQLSQMLSEENETGNGRGRRIWPWVLAALTGGVALALLWLNR
jgi:hypothetical protein